MSADRYGTILVVDDNAATLYSTSRVLRAAGYEVMEAATGGQALALAARRPDLVVLDVNLPDIDGFEVCRRLATRQETARTPVVHLSATFVRDADKVHGLEAGADGYLTHPVEPPVLVATVRAFLRARRAEDAMRASEAKFKAVFDQALHGIALVSDGMTFLDLNPAICRLIGHPREAIVGKHLSGFLPQAFEHHVVDIRAGLAQSGAWRGTFPLLHADGHEVELEWSVSIHSEPDIRLVIVSDVTERRQAEAERERLLASERAARAEAERANASKDDFLASLSHELRTPLNAIVGWSEVLKHKLRDGDPELLRAVGSIDRNARVQAQLIADLLDVSRITSGKLTLDLQAFDPAEAVDAAVDALVPVAEMRGVRIERRLTADGGQLLWDPARFQQVIWNLLDNAIKFSNPGGRVEVWLDGRGDAFAVSVRDNGRGIAADFLPFIFERFRQEDAITTRRHGGLGLGLAIVKNLVEAHGGTVSVESPGEGLGSTFTVVVPRQSRRAVAVQQDGRAARDLDGVRVLVVEDDQDARSVVSRVLRDARAEVREAADVRGALAILEAFAPQLLISDVGMPAEDGYHLIRRVRDRGYTAEALPAIALTAFARDEDRARALSAGYQRHLAKPVNLSRLLEVAAELSAGAASAGG